MQIKNKGLKSFDTFLESMLRQIIIGEPVNSFERGILVAYDECRSKVLKMYFPMLSNKDIKQLLRDNYLEKKDLNIYIKN